MLFRYSLKQIARRRGMNFLVILQFTFCIWIMIMVSEQMSQYFVLTNTIKEVCKENCYSVSYQTGYVTELSDQRTELYDNLDLEMASYNEQLEAGEITQEQYQSIYQEKLDEVRQYIEDHQLDITDEPINLDVLPYVEETYVNYSTWTLNEDHAGVKMLKREYAERLNFRMKSGIWLDEVTEDNHYIYLVVSSNSEYSVGDIIDLTNCSWSDKERKLTEISSIQGKVAGVIDYNYYKDLMENGSQTFGDFADVDTLFTIDDSLMYALYPEDMSLSLYQDMDIDADNNYYPMIKIQDGLTQAQMNELNQAAEQYHYKLENMNTAYENTYISDKKDFLNDIVFLTMACLISVFCLVGMSALCVAKELKTYSIYFLQGMTKHQCTGLIAIHTGMMISVSTVLAIVSNLAVSIWNYRIDYVAMVADFEMAGKDTSLVSSIILFRDYFTFGMQEALFISVLLVLSFVAAMIIPYKTLSKLQPVTILKEYS